MTERKEEAKEKKYKKGKNIEKENKIVSEEDEVNSQRIITDKGLIGESAVLT